MSIWGRFYLDILIFQKKKTEFKRFSFYIFNIYHKFCFLKISFNEKGVILYKKQSKCKKDIPCNITINHWRNCWNDYIWLYGL